MGRGRDSQKTEQLCFVYTRVCDFYLWTTSVITYSTQKISYVFVKLHFSGSLAHIQGLESVHPDFDPRWRGLSAVASCVGLVFGFCRAVLSGVVTTGHIWLLSTWNVVPPEEMCCECARFRWLSVRERDGHLISLLLVKVLPARWMFGSGGLKYIIKLISLFFMP